MAQVRVRKRGKTFNYIFEAGKTSDGRRKVVEKGGYESKSAAYDAGVAAYNDFKHGSIGITSESITVNDFMMVWLQNVSAIKPLTLNSIVYRLLHHALNHVVSMYMPLLLYHTGMRLGEVLGLTWDDIDFAAKRINLRRQMVYIRGQGQFFSTRESGASPKGVAGRLGHANATITQNLYTHNTLQTV